MSAATIRRHVTVRGDVQGVFFRESARRRAAEAGVAGWVTNRPDGSVEAVFEGAPDAVEALVAFARVGPTAASVDSIEVEEQSPEGLTGFDVR